MKPTITYHNYKAMQEAMEIVDERLKLFNAAIEDLRSEYYEKSRTNNNIK